VRAAAKNILAERTGGRKDHKIDCLAADLVTEFGNWSAAVRE
jgi:CheY-specific phosphatase CheX